MKVRSQCHIFVNIADETKGEGGKCYAWISFLNDDIALQKHVLLGEINEKAHDCDVHEHASMRPETSYVARHRHPQATTAPFMPFTTIQRY